MVVDKLTDEQVDRIFRALADSTRRDIVVRTLQEEYSVSGLAREYPMSFAAVQKHVAVLEDAALVTKRRQGREQLVSGNVATIRRAAQLLDELELLWRARMERFGDVLAEDLGDASQASAQPRSVQHPSDHAPVDRPPTKETR
jgi:DNA-binding transcriptional ArsR family regulator